MSGKEFKSHEELILLLMDDILKEMGFPYDWRNQLLSLK